jgi:N-acetylglucosamine-6-phosphate deacetylase
MATAVRNAVCKIGCDKASALRMASLAPAAFLGLDRELGRIEAGCRADLVRLDKQFQVLETWIDGVGAA